jgi:hypothetical protein
VGDSFTVNLKANTLSSGLSAGSSVKSKSQAPGKKAASTPAKAKNKATRGRKK